METGGSILLCKFSSYFHFLSFQALLLMENLYTSMKYGLYEVRFKL
jgi:hypothetical protein